MRLAAGAPVAVETLHDRGAISALRGEWERLRGEVAAAGGTAGPFLDPSWFGVMASSLARAPGAFKLLVAHRAGHVAGLLPLLSERRRLAGVPARVYRSLSDDHSQRFDVLVDGDEAARALHAHLAADEGWDAIELRDILDDGTPTGAGRIVAAARAAGSPTAKWDSMRSPFLPLPPSVEALDAQLDAKFRSNLRRRARKLAAEVGPIELERISADEAGRPLLDQALAEGFALEAAGWKGERKTAIACDSALIARYRALARAAGENLALYFLRVGGRRCAFHYAIADGGVYYLFKPGYDPELQKYGLGHLLVDAVAKDLIARGVRELDFLGDDMPWKREWTTQKRPHAWHYLFRDSWTGRARHAWKFRAAPALTRLIRRFRSAPDA